MELRRLQATDLFGMVKILNGIGLKNFKDVIDTNKIKEMRKSINDDNAEQVVSDIGMNVVMSVLSVILENLPSVETDLYNFIGSIANMKAKDVAKMDIGDFMDLLISIAQKEEFKDFFKRASKLIN